MDRSYLVSGTRKNARTSWTPPRMAPRPYHHSGVMAEAMGLAKRTQTEMRMTWMVCWIMRPRPRSCKKKISCGRSCQLELHMREFGHLYLCDHRNQSLALSSGETDDHTTAKLHLVRLGKSAENSTN